MASKYHEEENPISIALKIYQISRCLTNSSIRRRAQEISSKISNQNHPRLFTKAQEQVIVRTINHLRRYNIKLDGKDIEDFPNLLLWREYERDHPKG